MAAFTSSFAGAAVVSKVAAEKVRTRRGAGRGVLFATVGGLTGGAVAPFLLRR
jgi:hypothetical protein